MSARRPAPFFDSPGRVGGLRQNPAKGLRRIHRGEEEFPTTLDEVAPPVTSLWVVGRDLVCLGPCVAIVGARAPTSYGLEVARALAADLASTGICIVSGLARGIDAAAHEGALSVGGATIAVLGTGVDRPYPAANRRLYDRIAETGAIVSELELGADPRKEHFPARNRIIAGLSLGVVLVQGRAGKSGALGTARAAMDLGREVLAVPGDVRSDLSGGPHELLRDGAHLCAGAGDVLGVLRNELSRPPPDRPSDVLPRDPSEATVLAALSTGPARADQVAARGGLDVVTVNRVLTRLELNGSIIRGAAGVYRRAR